MLAAALSGSTAQLVVEVVADIVAVMRAGVFVGRPMREREVDRLFTEALPRFEAVPLSERRTALALIKPMVRQNLDPRPPQ